jgi:hypothetical protein
MRLHLVSLVGRAMRATKGVGVDFGRSDIKELWSIMRICYDTGQVMCFALLFNRYPWV